MKRAHNFIDLTGQRFNRLFVLEYIYIKNKQIYWKCQCDCGNVAIINGKYLRNGDTRSCGCLQKEIVSKRNKLNLIGKKFGRLVVLKEIGRNKNRHILWLCLCSCGTEVVISGISLTTGNTKSCGCYRKEKATKLREKNPAWNSCISDNEREKRREKRSGAIPEVEQWRLIIFKRDNYTCQICGQYGGDLCAHHIINWASSPNERLEINNGVTFCQKCHKTFHYIYGRSKNSAIQLNEFRAGKKI